MTSQRLWTATRRYTSLLRARISAANPPAAVDGTDRRTDGQTEGRTEGRRAPDRNGLFTRTHTLRVAAQGLVKALLVFLARMCERHYINPALHTRQAASMKGL